MNKMFTPTIVVFVTVLLLFHGTEAFAQSARALFYDPESRASLMSSHADSGQVATAAKPSSSAAAPAKNTGVRYWIELDNPGRSNKLRVNADRAFRSGDRIRIHYSSNVDGYLYIMQKGSTGKETLLFPTRVSNRENFVKAGQDLTAPEPGWFKFDEYPGYERLHIYFQPGNGDPGLLKKVTAPGTSLDDLQTEVAMLVSRQKGSRDLVAEFDNSYFELNPSETGAPADMQDAKIGRLPTGTTPPAAYVVNTTKEKYAAPVVFEIFLRHQ